MVSRGSFDLHFANNQWCWTLFHVLIGHPYIFLGEMSLKVLCPFFNWIVGVFWYILELSPLSVASFETIFSHSVSCLFGFFLVSIAMQKLVSLIGSQRVITFILTSVAVDYHLMALGPGIHVKVWIKYKQVGFCLLFLTLSFLPLCSFIIPLLPLKLIWTTSFSEEPLDHIFLLLHPSISLLSFLISFHSLLMSQSGLP